MMFNRRELMRGVAATGLFFGTGQKAMAQGMGAGQTDYPGGYRESVEPVPEGRPTFATVREGLLEGVAAANGIRYFRGIPYAAPPVGTLRFKRPAPHPGWLGTRKAVENPAAPIQSHRDLVSSNAPSDTRVSEDCLTLSITAPSTAGPHPVYVFFHGGGNFSGWQLEDRVDGASFARDGVVFVTVGYRVGILGFLELGKLIGPDYAGSGNNAIWDQITALKWLRANIGAFGGDPDQLTIGGQSAGAFDVCAMLGAPSTTGLYRAAISQSGGDGTVLTKDEVFASADRVATAFAKKGIQGRDILTAPVEHFFDRVPGFQNAAFVDGELLTAKPREATASGVNKDVSLLIGWDRDEIAGMGNDASGPLFERFKALNPGLTDEQWKRRFGATRLFGAPSWIMADSHASGGGSTYAYYWTWAPTSGRNAGFAFHGAEMSYVFDNVEALRARYIVPDAAIQARATAMHALWVNFIKTGKPTAPGVPAWPQWTPSSRRYLEIDNGFRISELPHAHIALWRD
ncbi:carboxylesterase/lipase family protein [Neorhizobium sp. DT-125]